ncbi:MAG: DUF1501 domain-containing protein [Gemmatimonadaceae bacterium]
MTDTLKHDCDACAEYNELSRRQFIGEGFMLGAGVFATAMYPEWLPHVVLAQTANSRDIIVSVFLRGGSDGLSMVYPYNDPLFYAGRPTIAIPRPDSSNTAQRGIVIDNTWAVSRPLAPILPAYQAGELLILHASGSVDPSRSHFDAQKFIEVGKPRDPNVATGWLARHLATAPPLRTSAPLRALGLSDGLARTLVGAPKTLPISDPANFGLQGNVATRPERTAFIRSEYELSAEPVRASALDAMNTIGLLQQLNITGYRPANGAVYPNSAFGRALRSCAALIKGDIGVEALHVDIGGWDTHANQDPLAGSMFNTMNNLFGSLGAFWQDVINGGYPGGVTVIVISEFGRNVRENGTRGTDHGRGNVMFCMGKGIAGGRVMVNTWPGLAIENLENRADLRVTLDHRDVLAEIVSKRLGNNQVNVVFPDYTATFRGVTK